jgi:hypothetical protein
MPDVTPPPGGRVPDYDRYYELQRRAEAGDEMAIAVLGLGQQIAEEGFDRLTSMISALGLSTRHARDLMRRAVYETIVGMYQDATMHGMGDAIEGMEARLGRIAREIYEREHMADTGPLARTLRWLRRFLGR